MKKCKDKYIRIDKIILLSSEGKSWTEIAKIIGISLTRLYQIRQTDEFQEAVAEFMEVSSQSVALQYNELVKGVLKTYKRINTGKVNTSEDAIRIASCKATIDAIHKMGGFLQGKNLNKPVNIEIIYADTEDESDTVELD